MKLNAASWQNRYLSSQTGWDTGKPNRPIMEYVLQIADQKTKMLFPGCGNAYEAEALFNAGYKHVHVLDYAKKPLENLKNRCPDFPDANIHCGDFFEHTSQYDLILEQTFFCAINPSLRNDYAIHANKLLKENGLLIGLLFKSEMNTDQPPFGGNMESYKSIFNKQFSIVKIEDCYNSIPPRAGNELFIILEKNTIH